MRVPAAVAIFCRRLLEAVKLPKRALALFPPKDLILTLRNGVEGVKKGFGWAVAQSMPFLASGV